MKLEYGNIVKIYLKAQVEKIEDNKVHPFPGESPVIVHGDDFEAEPSTTDSKSSLLTTTPITMFIDKLNVDTGIFRMKRSVIIEICQSDGETKVIGSIRYPAHLIFSKSLNKDIFKITHKQPSYLD